MKNGLTIIGVSAALMLISFQSYATNGYKGIKFGTSVDVVKKQARCTFIGPTPSDIGEMWSCNDFLFAGKQTGAAFFFNDNKLIRLGFTIPSASQPKTFEGLKEKYGVKKAPTQEQLKAFDTLPNQKIQIEFNDNVTILMTSDQHINQVVYLIYDSPDFKEIQDSRNTVAESDL